MSIYIRCPVKNRTNQYLKNRIDHILDSKKTSKELIIARGVTKQKPYEGMLFIKKIFAKVDNRPYIHWVLSFDEDVSTELAYKVGDDVAELIYREYCMQVFATVHCNTNNRHVHYIINATSFKDGKMFSEGKGAMYKFRNKLNKILRAYNLSETGEVNDFYGTREDDDELIDELINKINYNTKDVGIAEEKSLENNKWKSKSEPTEYKKEKLQFYDQNKETKEKKDCSKDVAHSNEEIYTKEIDGRKEYLDSTSEDIKEYLEDDIGMEYYAKIPDKPYEEEMARIEAEERKEEKLKLSKKRNKTDYSTRLIKRVTTEGYFPDFTDTTPLKELEELEKHKEENNNMNIQRKTYKKKNYQTGRNYNNGYNNNYQYNNVQSNYPMNNCDYNAQNNYPMNNGYNNVQNYNNQTGIVNSEQYGLNTNYVNNYIPNNTIQVAEYNNQYGKGTVIVVPDAKEGEGNNVVRLLYSRGCY